ncbi:hypothetical protein VM1G_07997 [Cytospora mali]|uniref:Uncharacterized protein n=1 Tax=Cytospora mali TaxID=578113 RepID=A0A194W763_CYTMA|nr:hypothetical protein VM1G_07997 [Valsa mali]
MAKEDLAFLIIYALLFLATVIILFLHGLDRLAWLGWGYLAVFCGLKIASNALQLTNTGTAAAVLICSMALVFLTLAVAFILRAALSYACTPSERPPRHKTFDLELATGPQRLPNPGRAGSHAGAGAMVLVLSTVLVCAVALLGYDDLRRPEGHPLRPQRRERLGRRLVLADAVAGVFLAVRIGGGLHWFFGRGPEANPVTGRLALRLALGTLPEVLAVLALVVGGVVTWNIAG